MKELLAVALLSSLGASLLMAYYVLGKNRKLFYLANLLTGASLVALGGFLILRGLIQNRHPVGNKFEGILFLCFWLLFFHFLLQLKYKEKSYVNGIVPVSFILIAVSLVLNKKEVLLLGGKNAFWLGLHTGFSLLGEAAIFVAFLSAVIFLFQHKVLKEKNVSRLFYRLPSLESLDKIALLALFIGWFFLSIGIFTGLLWSKFFFGKFLLFDIVEIWSFFSWLILAGNLLLRLKGKVDSKKFSLLLIMGFLSILILWGVINNFSNFHNYKKMMEFFHHE